MRSNGPLQTSVDDRLLMMAAGLEWRLNDGVRPLPSPKCRISQSNCLTRLMYSHFYSLYNVVHRFIHEFLVQNM